MTWKLTVARWKRQPNFRAPARGREARAGTPKSSAEKRPADGRESPLEGGALWLRQGLSLQPQWLNRGGQRRSLTDHRFREPLHLLKLRAELQQQQIHACLFEFCDAFGDLLGSPHQARAQPAVGHRIILERNALLELRSGKPLLIVLVPSGALFDVGDARELLLRLAFGLAHHDVPRHAVLHRRKSPTRAPR